MDVIYPDPTKPSTFEPSIDLVFIHGLGGTQLGTWTEETSGKLWISDPEFLGKLKDQARVLAFGYNANLISEVTTQRVVNHASDLLEKLNAKRSDCQVCCDRIRPNEYTRCACV